MKKSIVQLVSCCLVVLVSSRQVYGSASVSPSLTSSLPASTIKSSSAPADLGLSESRSSSSYDREAENSYGKRGNAYESSEDSSDEYNQKGSGKKTVILAIPVKLALQQQKQQESYQSSQQSSYGDRDNGRGNSYGDRDRGNSYGDRDRGNSYGDRDRGNSYDNQDRYQQPPQDSGRGSSYGYEGSNYEQNPREERYRGDRNERNEYRESYRPSSSSSRDRDNYPREQQPPQYSAQPQYPSSQTSSRYHSASSNDRDQPIYNDKAPPRPSSYNDDEDSSYPDNQGSSGGQSYTIKAQIQDKPPKYESADSAQYDSHEDAPVVSKPKAKKQKQQVIHEYQEVSGDDHPGSSALSESNYSPSNSYPLAASLKEGSSKFTLPDGETFNLESLGSAFSGSYPGSYSSPSELKGLSYDGEGLSSSTSGLEDDFSAVSALSSQMNPYPSIAGSVPQSELSFLLNKMPRGGFSPLPAASSPFGTVGPSFTAIRPHSPAYGYPRVAAGLRPRPLYPSYAPFPKTSYPGSSYAASSPNKMYLPSASAPYKSYASPSYSPYPSASSSYPSSYPSSSSYSSPSSSASSSDSSSFPSFGGTKIGGIRVSKGMAGKGLRIGPFELGAPSGSIPFFPTIKIKAGSIIKS